MKGMKYITSLLACALWLPGIAAEPILADLAVGAIDITNAFNESVNANTLSRNRVYRLHVPIMNITQDQWIPPNTCRVQIGLGSGFTVYSGCQLNNVPLSQYFEWTTSTAPGGQAQINGRLRSQLPSDFEGVAVFEIWSEQIYTSEFSANFLTSNNNIDYSLSDISAGNNSSALSYTVTPALPVTFIDFKAEKKECSVFLEWKVADEINVNRYEIEMGSNESSFVKRGVVAAANMPAYSFKLDIDAAWQSPSLYFRIKAVDNDGKFLFSGTERTGGECKVLSGWKLQAFPNPHPGRESLTISLKEGSFDGNYTVKVMDNSGRLVKSGGYELKKVSSFQFPIAQLPAARYFISVVSDDGTQSGTIDLVKTK